MTHEQAWMRLPDLLEDRDQPELLTHVAACHVCQRQLFLLSRVDRALRGAAVRRKGRHRPAGSHWLRFPSGLVAAAVAALVVFMLVPHHGGLRQLTLRTVGGHPLGQATLKREDAENTSLTLVARGLPARNGDTFVLWAAGGRDGRIAVGRFMVSPGGACHARFNLPGKRVWTRFWVTPRGRPKAIVATT
jgi:hypothetical protein